MAKHVAKVFYFVLKLPGQTYQCSTARTARQLLQGICIDGRALTQKFCQSADGWEYHCQQGLMVHLCPWAAPSLQQTPLTVYGPSSAEVTE